MSFSVRALLVSVRKGPHFRHASASICVSSCVSSQGSRGSDFPLSIALSSLHCCRRSCGVRPLMTSHLMAPRVFEDGGGASNFDPASKSTFIKISRRFLSSSGDEVPDGRRRERRRHLKKEAKTIARTWTLLYHRPPARSILPRAMLGTASLSLVYWTWYVADFVPTLNASAEALFAAGRINAESLELMSLDPLVGGVGLGMSTLFWVGSVSYVRHLVSAIWKSSSDEDGGDDDEEGSSPPLLAVSTLRLPFATQPGVLGKIRYDPESNPFESERDVVFADEEIKSEGSSITIFRPGELTLVGEKDVNDLLVKFGGDFGRKKGHLALKRTPCDIEGEASTGASLPFLPTQNWLLDIGSGAEIMTDANPHLLRSLVIRDHHRSGAKESRGRTSREDSGNDEKGEEERNVEESVNIGKYILKKKGLSKKRRR